MLPMRVSLDANIQRSIMFLKIENRALINENQLAYGSAELIVM